jgi:molecular chaperone GrpE
MAKTKDQSLDKEAPEAQTEESQVNDNQELDQETPQESAEGEKSELEQLQEELEQSKNQRLRLFADFENYKKRTARERIELFDSANQDLMSALLPVVDDFKRALQNMESEAQEGVELIFNKFLNTLKQKGLKPMESTIGRDFDVDTMEAITRIPAPEPEQKGKVIDEIEQGFELGKKIIRYAKVVVGE